MQSMEELPRLVLVCYQGVSLPNCICQFQNLKFLILSSCKNLEELPVLEIGSEAARDDFPRWEELYLFDLYRLESIVCNPKAMPRLRSLAINDCPVLKTLRMEDLTNFRVLDIKDCAELKELFMETGGGFPKLQTLILWSLQRLESIVCNAKTMPQLHSLHIRECRRLKTLRMEEFAHLEPIKISECPQLEVEINSLPLLKKLTLAGLEKAESIARPSSVWNEETMPNLEVIEIKGCRLLGRMPKEMEKLPKLKEIAGESRWWDEISWENDDVKSKLSPFQRI